MEDVGIFYGHMVYFTAIDIVYFGNLVYLSPFWYIVTLVNNHPMGDFSPNLVTLLS
jgi:hypothetical protein